jgi:hypothetical protein
VQLVARLEVQLSVLACPVTIVDGLAVRVTEGPPLDTVTVVDWLALPPEPVQVRV